MNEDKKLPHSSTIMPDKKNIELTFPSREKYDEYLNLVKELEIADRQLDALIQKYNVIV